MHTTSEKLQQFERLLEIMTELRAKCPWDKEQTFDSMRVQTIEETYELVDAIIQKDKISICKELGDLLLHVVFYAQMGSETDDFDMYDVCKSLNEKLTYRHPHVFGETEANNAKEVVQNWEQLKLKEKGGNKSVLSGVPDALPALIKAHRIQDKARSVGFDWEEREQVWDKVQEEFTELKVEINENDKDKMEAEFGDLLFSMVNAARLYDINPENALERTNRKFISRFNYLESKTITQGIDLKAMSLADMDVIWEEAKKKENGPLNPPKGGL
jgi:XTP/dITP diphosphohydrolase